MCNEKEDAKSFDLTSAVYCSEHRSISFDNSHFDHFGPWMCKLKCEEKFSKSIWAHPHNSKNIQSHL